ncbi:MAG: hypothetical protein IKU07_07070 [Oscillospiraceae bacterium]|nr:hypothetical protein [Oscillospiraceae bacterium]
MKKYLHPAIIKKDLGRFAPLWGLASVFVALYLLLSWTLTESSAELFSMAEFILQSMGVVTFLYAGICGLCLFGDLFDTRLCNALHAMPVSREGWFWSHAVSGLLFCLIPAGVGTLLGSLMLGKYFYGALLWLALTVLEFLFFFGAAAFASMCGGTALGAVAVYTLINFFVYLVTFVFTYLFQPLLYGVITDMNALLPLSPVSQLTSLEFLTINFDYDFHKITLIRNCPGDWLYMGLVAIFGIGLLVLALVLYKKRHMESAGNTISFRPVAPVLLVLYTLCVGVFLYLIADTVEFLPWVMLLVGLALGFFTGRMLLEKQVKVFYKKNLLSFGLLVLALSLALGLTKLDPLGISRYVPKAEDVVSVTMTPTQNTMLYGGNYIILTEREDIEKILAMNEEAIKEGKPSDSFSVFLHYKLKNGETVKRQYELSDTQEHREFVSTFYSRWECLVGNISKEELLGKLIYAQVYDWDDTISQFWISEDYSRVEYYSKEENALILPKVGEDEIVKQLIDAIYADCQRGAMSQANNASTTMGSIVLQVGSLAEDVQYIDINYYENCENILNVLAQLKANDTP